jgi:hypothetical protein
MAKRGCSEGIPDLGPCIPRGLGPAEEEGGDGNAHLVCMMICKHS